MSVHNYNCQSCHYVAFNGPDLMTHTSMAHGNLFMAAAYNSHQVGTDLDLLVKSGLQFCDMLCSSFYGNIAKLDKKTGSISCYDCKNE